MDGSVSQISSALLVEIEENVEAYELLHSMMPELAINAETISALSVAVFSVDVGQLTKDQFDRYVYLTSKHHGVISDADNAAILQEVFKNAHPLSEAERKEYVQFIGVRK